MKRNCRGFFFFLEDFLQGSTLILLIWCVCLGWFKKRAHGKSVFAFLLSILLFGYFFKINIHFPHLGPILCFCFARKIKQRNLIEKSMICNWLIMAYLFNIKNFVYSINESYIFATIILFLHAWEFKPEQHVYRLYQFYLFFCIFFPFQMSQPLIKSQILLISSANSPILVILSLPKPHASILQIIHRKMTKNLSHRYPTSISLYGMCLNGP